MIIYIYIYMISNDFTFVLKNDILLLFEILYYYFGLEGPL